MNNVTIIGTGPAGLTAAIYTARAGLEPVIYTGIQHGGQLTTTTEVENYPGFADPIMGPKLMEDMTEQAKRVGAKVLYREISKVDFSSNPLRLWNDDNELIESKTVIIATGATAKTLGLPDEHKLMGRGLSTCATCDGFFYKNKKVLVVGGGDSAMEEALYLAKLCKELVLVHRRKEFRASLIMLERARKSGKITFMSPFTVATLLHDQRGLTGAVLENTQTGETQELVCDGIFYAIGHKPNSEIFAPYVDRDKNGYILVTEFAKTRTPGVFAAGDIADPVFRQAITAAGLGCQAGIQATKYIEEHHES
ncbi:MAG: thioredoxin-disulfide reductase [Deltaproteobacteria bacterium]|nr:thioredoxin-disulfide reductase [Deltaproteobacteria bacterium]